MGCAGKSGYVFSRYEVPPVGAREFLDGYRPGDGVAIHCGVALLGGFGGARKLANSELAKTVREVYGDRVEIHLVFCGRDELVRRANERRHFGVTTTGHSVGGEYGFETREQYGAAHQRLHANLLTLGWKVVLIHSFRNRFYEVPVARFQRIVDRGETFGDVAAVRLGIRRPVSIRGRPIGARG